MEFIPQAEDTENSAYSFFEATDFGPIAAMSDNSVSVIAHAREDQFLDSLLAAIKWIFLYIPGAAAFHMIMMGFALLLLHSDWSSPMMLGTLGILIFTTFMVMLGIGKLGDLKYLRVVGGIFGMSALAAIVYPIMASLIPGDYFGLFAKCTLLMTILAGYLVKRHTDKI